MISQKVCHEYYIGNETEYKEVCEDPNYFDQPVGDGFNCVNEFCENTIVTFDEKNIDDMWKKEFR